MMHSKELEVMSVGLSTLPQMQIAFFDSVSQFVNRFQQLVDGSGSDVINEVVGGGRIRYVFHSMCLWEMLSRCVPREDGGT